MAIEVVKEVSKHHPIGNAEFMKRTHDGQVQRQNIISYEFGRKYVGSDMEQTAVKTRYRNAKGDDWHLVTDVDPAEWERYMNMPDPGAKARGKKDGGFVQWMRTWGQRLRIVG